jgi:poly(A) polymerase
MDIIYFKIFKSKKVDNNLLTMIKIFEEKEIPVMPVGAIMLMKKYNIPEGKKLGNKLKKIEELWVNNNFEINEKEVQKIINN